MIKQNVNIVNFNSLYEILSEVKENLPFNIVKYENEKNYLSQANSSSQESLKLSKEYLKVQNLLIFKKLPLSLNKLVELININLIQLKFNHQSKINIKKYQLDLNSKFFSKENINLKLTEKEIEIILYLNETKTKHSVSDLQKNIWDYSPGMETHTVETHIYRLRKKISNKFNDENFILSDEKGYFIG